jgi:hypothetical protein
MVMIDVVLGPLGVVVQSNVALLMLFLNFNATLLFQPFEAKHIARLELISLGISFMTLWLGSFYWSTTNETFSVLLTVLIVIINTIFLVCLLHTLIGDGCRDYQVVQTISKIRIKMRQSHIERNLVLQEGPEKNERVGSSVEKDSEVADRNIHDRMYRSPDAAIMRSGDCDGGEFKRKEKAGQNNVKKSQGSRTGRPGGVFGRRHKTLSPRTAYSNATRRKNQSLATRSPPKPSMALLNPLVQRRSNVHVVNCAPKDENEPTEMSVEMTALTVESDIIEATDAQDANDPDESSALGMWERNEDPKSGKPYLVNLVSGESKWIDSEDDGDDRDDSGSLGVWERYEDPKSGNPYLVNSVSGVSKWVDSGDEDGNEEDSSIQSSFNPMLNHSM